MKNALSKLEYLLTQIALHIQTQWHLHDIWSLKKAWHLVMKKQTSIARVFIGHLLHSIPSFTVNPVRVHNTVRGKDVRHQNNRENWLIMFYYKLKGVLVCFCWHGSRICLLFVVFIGFTYLFQFLLLIYSRSKQICNMPTRLDQDWLLSWQPFTTTTSGNVSKRQRQIQQIPPTRLPT